MWPHVPAPDLAWSSAFEEAGWVRDRLHPFGRDIGSVIPDCFDAYVAIVHPDRRHELPAKLLERLINVLRTQTAPAQRCWICIWEGYAWMHGGRAVSSNPPGLVPEPVRIRGRVRLPHRNYYLYRGDIGEAAAFVPWGLRPNLWWPEDRSWCVATEIDNIATYVAGTSQLADALLGNRAFDAIAVTPTEPMQNGRDYYWPTRS